MPLSSKTLTAIETAGSAAFKANAQLKAAVKDYGDQVQAAMLQRPFDVSNDGLFEEWKSVSRLSQAMAQIEAELQKIHAGASVLQGATLATKKPGAGAATAPAPTQAMAVDVVSNLGAADLAVKKTRKLKAKNKVKAKTTAKPQAAGPLPANAASLLAHLNKVLNADTFEKINQTSVAAAINMPKGSVGASVNRLVKEGFLIQDAALGFKLSLPAA